MKRDINSSKRGCHFATFVVVRGGGHGGGQPRFAITDTYDQCKNGGAAGTVDVGCLKHSITVIS